MAEFTRPLVLTTPHLKGQRVKDCQYLLAGHNRFEGLAPYKDGKIDGDYGPQTAQAVYRAKYWLGFAEPDINQAFGQRVYEYLRVKDWRPLPPDYRKRREARIAAAVQTPGLKAYALLHSYLGYKETPRNWTFFGRWFGMDGNPWCAMSESYCFAHTGWSRFRYASVEQIYWDARAGRNHMRFVSAPQRGDVVLYSLHGHRYAHTGFFDHWIDQSRGVFQDLAGNTGPSSISNGGMVAYGQRATNVVLAFVRVG